MDRDAAGKLSPSEYDEYRRHPFGMADPDCLLETLSEGFCAKCRLLLQQRLQLLFFPTTTQRLYPRDFTPESRDHYYNSEVSYHGDENAPKSRHGHCRSPERISYSAVGEHCGGYSPTEENRKRKRRFLEYSDADLILDDGIPEVPSNCDDGLSEEQKEKLRFLKVRKQEFVHLEEIDGKLKNILQGLELHAGVFNKEEQKNIVDYVYHLQSMGQRGQLRSINSSPYFAF